MTCAGEKLYGAWHRLEDNRGLVGSRNFRRGFVHMILLLTLAAAALFGFG